MDRLSLEEATSTPLPSTNGQKAMPDQQLRKRSSVVTRPQPVAQQEDRPNRTSTSLPDQSAPPSQPTPSPKSKPTTSTTTTTIAINTNHNNNNNNNVNDDNDTDPIDPTDLPHRYTDLQRHYRILTREHRSLYHTYTDLKRTHSSLLSAYSHATTSTSPTSTSLTNTERFKYQSHFSLLEARALHYHTEYRKREDHLSYLTSQTREANAAREGVEEEKRGLERRVRELQGALTEARDDLLRLQPAGGSGVADSEVSGLWGDLVQGVSVWVDEVMDSDDVEDVLEAHFEGLKEWRELPEAVRMGGELGVDKRRFGLARKYPECLPLLVQMIVHAVVGREVLGEQVYLYGLHEEHVDLLKGVEEGMGELRPKRDTPTILHHRSETLSSILAMPVFRASQLLQSESLAQSLASTLSLLLCSPTTSNLTSTTTTTSPSSTSTPINWRTLHTTIISPAITLSNKIRVARTPYTFFTHTHPHPQARSRPANNDERHTFSVSKEDASSCRMLDCATQKVVRGDSAVKVAEDGSGRIGEEMFVVSPGLMKGRVGGREYLGGNGSGHESSEGGSAGSERTVLVRPTMLVRLDEPMGRKKGGGGGGGGGGGLKLPTWLGGSGIGGGGERLEGS